VATYWIVNLVVRQLEVFRTPDSGDFTLERILGPTEQVELTIEGTLVGRINVADLLP
jgi:hypothetical protein